MQVATDLKNFRQLIPIVCMVSFFARTIFIGYKYVFFLSLPLTIALVVLSKNYVAIQKINYKKLVLPLSILLFYFLHFSFIDNVVKESINTLVLLSFFTFFDTGNKRILIKTFLIFVNIAGVIAICKFCVLLIAPSITIPSFLFETAFFTLVRDNNFYALHFILAIIASFFLLNEEKISKLHFLLCNSVSIVNIIASISRRAYVLYSILIIVVIILYFRMGGIRKYAYKAHMCILSIIILLSIPIGVSLKDTLIEKMKDPGNSLFWLCHKAITLFNSSLSPQSYLQIVQGQKKEWVNDANKEDNLFYNGNFDSDMRNWGSFNSSNDIIYREIIKTTTGEKYLRINREQGMGYWQLLYTGRPIFYHKDKMYTISFKYRIIEGDQNSFNVGWNVYDAKSKLSNLPQKVTKIDDEWNLCSVSYVFKENHINPICLMNCMKAGTVIDVTDIKLMCNDSIGLPMYVDQMPDSVVSNSYSTNEGENYLIVSRFDRWKYALEIWQTRYDWKQKIFGHGFDYLEWYGERFYNNPKRYDFPHNPIISSFLYSGIIGGVVYIWFLIMSLCLYWKKRQQLGLLFIMYLCCMFFCMFSGNSHFSFPLFVFLSFMPFVEYEGIRGDE